MRIRASLRIGIAVVAVLLLIGLVAAGRFMAHNQRLADEQLLAARVGDEADALLLRMPLPPEAEASQNWVTVREAVRRIGGLLQSGPEEWPTSMPRSDTAASNATVQNDPQNPTTASTTTPRTSRDAASGSTGEYSERRPERKQVLLSHARLMAALDWAPALPLAPAAATTSGPAASPNPTSGPEAQPATGTAGPRAVSAPASNASASRIPFAQASPSPAPVINALSARPLAHPSLQNGVQELVLMTHAWRDAVATEREGLLWTALTVISVLGVLLLIISLAVLWEVRRKLLLPIESLRSQVQAIEQGKLDSRISAVGAREVQALADRFNGLRDAMLYNNRRLEGMNRNLQEEIRQRQSAEAALRDNNRDLENRVTRRTEDLARYATLLERRNLDLRRFTRVASHDMRTPLRAIASFSGILKSHLDGQLDEQARNWFARVENNTVRLESLVDDLLTYSQFDSRDLQWVRLDMSQVLDESLNLLGESVADTGAQVSVQPGLPVVEADRTAMVNVFMNLIGNALKFRSAEAPRIAITGERRESETCYTVEDNGIGIAPAFRDQVFEPFKRLHAQHDIPGTGLGLAICRRILERHGGHIWVEPTDSHGSRFCFVIPDRKPLHAG